MIATFRQAVERHGYTQNVVAEACPKAKANLAKMGAAAREESPLKRLDVVNQVKKDSYSKEATAKLEAEMLKDQVTGNSSV